ncbi:hypothetical protein GcM3_182023 [Golovinomyces cichoracearum]|uniref:Uncharacterized protein n=1 Tax=Golovinomyces cichoracearum TaxID=62708 RepID=A0A420HLP6_9PEZI|nr:hypothetical protein GcM3_182023 [Golovinomyces cichoracearum]
MSEAMDTEGRQQTELAQPEISMNQLYDQILLMQQQFNQQSAIVQNQYELIEEQKAQKLTLREQVNSNPVAANV